MPAFSRPEPLPELPEATEATEKLRLVRGEDLLSIPEPEWLIPDFVQEAGLTIMHGLPGSGKTLVALELASVIQQGWQYLGRQSVQGQVLYILGEGQGYVAGRQLAWMKSRHTEQFPNLLWRLMPLNFYRNHDDYTLDQEALLEVIEEFDVKLVVVDTLARNTAGSNENTQQDMNRVVEMFDKLREYGCATLLLHHDSRQGKTIRGSTVLEGAAETIIHLIPKFKQGSEYGNELQFVEMRNTKQKDGVPFRTAQLKPVEYDYERDGETKSHVVLEGGHLESKADVGPEAANLLYTVQENPGLTYSRLFEASDVGGKGKFNRILQGLVEEGVVDKRDKEFFAVVEEPKEL
jgi:hypothetical protein